MNYIKSILNLLLTLLQYSVIIECVGSWLPGFSGYKIFEFFTKINAPFLNPIRKLMFNLSQGMPLDFSPVILFMIIGIIRRLLWMI